MNENEYVRTILNLIRESADSVQSEGDGVPYSNPSDNMLSILEVAKTQFGADFSGIKNPLMYYPSDNNVVLNGNVGSINGLKFTFSYKDGCSIWFDKDNPVELSDDTLSKLNVIYGVFKNWKKDVESSEDVKPIDLRDMDNNNEQPQTNGPKVPGDDF